MGSKLEVRDGPSRFVRKSIRKSCTGGIFLFPRKWLRKVLVRVLDYREHIHRRRRGQEMELEERGYSCAGVAGREPSTGANIE